MLVCIYEFHRRNSVTKAIWRDTIAKLSVIKHWIYRIIVVTACPSFWCVEVNLKKLGQFSQVWKFPIQFPKKKAAKGIIFISRQFPTCSEQTAQYWCTEKQDSFNRTYLYFIQVNIFLWLLCLLGFGFPVHLWRKASKREPSSLAMVAVWRTASSQIEVNGWITVNMLVTFARYPAQFNKRRHGAFISHSIQDWCIAKIIFASACWCKLPS